MASITKEHLPEHGDVTVVSVCEGKYGFVIKDETDLLVEMRRYGERWNHEDWFSIKYSRGIGALAAELTDALRETA